MKLCIPDTVIVGGMCGLLVGLFFGMLGYISVERIYYPAISLHEAQEIYLGGIAVGIAIMLAIWGGVKLMKDGTS